MALHPERQAEIDALSERVEEAAGTISRENDAIGWTCVPRTDGEIVLALEQIVQVMKEAAPLLRNPSRGH